MIKAQYCSQRMDDVKETVPNCFIQKGFDLSIVQKLQR